MDGPAALPLAKGETCVAGFGEPANGIQQRTPKRVETLSCLACKASVASTASRLQPPGQQCSIPPCPAMEPPRAGSLLRGRHPSTASAEGEESRREVRECGACQYRSTVERSTSASCVGNDCSLRRRDCVGPVSQVASKNAEGKKTGSLDRKSHNQETLYEYLGGRSPSCGGQQESGLELQDGWPSLDLQPASYRSPSFPLPPVDKAAAWFSVNGENDCDQLCRYCPASYNTDLQRIEGGSVRENSANARSALRTSNVVASGCSQKYLSGTQECSHSGAGLKEGLWSSPVRTAPPSQHRICDESPFFGRHSSEQVSFAFEKEQVDASFPPACFHTPGPTAAAAEDRTCAGLDVHLLYQEHGSSVPTLCTMNGTGCSSETLKSSESADGLFAGKRSRCSHGSTSCESSSGLQGVSRRGSMSSVFTSFTPSGCSSASTFACASPHRESLYGEAEESSPSPSCSRDLASYSVACQTPRSASQDFSSLKPVTVAGTQPSPSTSHLAAAADAGGQREQAATHLRIPGCMKSVLRKAVANSYDHSAKEIGPVARTNETSPATPSPMSGGSAASGEVVGADVSICTVADLNTSDIVLSCGLPPPESSAPVNLACRLLIGRYAAAAATAADAATCRAAGGGTGEEVGGKGCSLETVDEKSSCGGRLEKYADCGWAWQEDGGGLLLLRLQRKQLDKGKVKSAGYEAFGRAYGLPVGRSANSFAPWSQVYSHVDTMMQKDAVRCTIRDVRHDFACAASAAGNSAPALEGSSISTEGNSERIPSACFSQFSSAQGCRKLSTPLTETLRRHSEETALAITPRPRSCRRSVSTGVSPAAYNCLRRELAARDRVDDPVHAWPLKELIPRDARGGKRNEERTFRNGGESDGSQSGSETRPCHCCGDRRKKLVCCTRSARLLETKVEGISERAGVAAVISTAVQEGAREGARGRPTSLSRHENDLHRETAKTNVQKYSVAPAAPRHAAKRHSTCDGRLEGWRAHQLSVRVILRNTGPPAAAPLISEDSSAAARQRLRKRVTFSVDHFSSDGETMPRVFCSLCPPWPQEPPLCQPLISRVHSSTYRQASLVLSRRRSDCSSDAAAAAPLVVGGQRTAAALAAGEGEEKGRETGPVKRKQGRVDVDKSAGISAATAPPEDARLREESFYILVSCRRPTGRSRWTRKGRTVVSRKCTPYAGPLLPLVTSLLERERQAVRVRCVDEGAQGKEGCRSKTQQLTKESPFSWLRRAAVTAQSPQRPQVKDSEQQQQQMVLQHRPRRETQQKLPQRRQAAHPSAQTWQPQQRPQDMRTKQQEQREVQSIGPAIGCAAQWHEQAAAVKRSATLEVARREPLPRERLDHVGNKERDNRVRGEEQRDCTVYQTSRATWSHVCPRFHHPLDTPETLFPQARARQLRRLLLLQNASPFPTVDDPLVLSTGLPLLQGGAAAAGALGEGNLAVYHQLDRCSVAARAVAMAAAAGRPVVLPQLSSTLQHQHARREGFFSSPYSLPESTAADQGHLSHGTSGMGSAPRVPSGAWYRKGRSGRMGPLRAAASCSFAFEHGGVEGSSDKKCRRSSVRGATRSFERGRGDVDADEEEAEAEESYPRRRLPRLFRKRRNSDAAGQGVTEGHGMLSRVSSLNRYQQHGTDAGSKRTTGEKLKRFLVPLFLRSFSSSTTDARRQGGGADEEEESDGSLAASSEDSEHQSERLAVSAEEDDENLWITESEASTPSSSSYYSVLTVKEDVPQTSQQHQAERTHTGEGKGGRGQAVVPPSTPEHRNVGKLLRRSATEEFVRVSPRQQRPRGRLRQVNLRGRQPQALKLKRPEEKPSEEIKAQAKGILAVEAHPPAVEQDIDNQAEDGKAAVPASERKPEESSRESGGEALQQHSGQTSQLQQQRQRREQPPRQHTEEQTKRVEGKRTEQQQCQTQERKPGVQMHEQGGSQSSKQHALQQIPATATVAKLSVECVFPLREKPLCQDQEKKEQEPLEPRSQQKEQQQRLRLPVVGEAQPVPVHLMDAEQARSGEEKSRGNSHTTSPNGEVMHPYSTRERDAGVSGSFEEVMGTQTKKEQDETRTECLDGGGESGFSNADSQSTPIALTSSKQQPCFCTVDNRENVLQRVEGAGTYEQPRVEQYIVRHLHGDAPQVCEQELDGAAEDGVSVDKKARPRCTQQPTTEEGPSTPSKDLATNALSSQTQLSDVQGSSNKTDIGSVDHGTLEAKTERDGLDNCSGAAYQTAPESVCVTNHGEEIAQGKPEGQAGGGLGDASCVDGSRAPLRTSFPETQPPAPAGEEVASADGIYSNAPSSSSLMRQGAQPNHLPSAEGRAISTPEVNRLRTGGGLRWRWRRSSERGRVVKSGGSEECLYAPGASAEGFSQISGPPAPAAVSAPAIPGAAAVTAAAAAPPGAAAGAAATLRLCNDEQVASSTAAGSQQTVSSQLPSRRAPSKKNSLLTAAFDQVAAPRSTRSASQNRDEPRNLPTLLQRLSTRFRRRRDFGADDASEAAAAQCTSDTTQA